MLSSVPGLGRLLGSDPLEEVRERHEALRKAVEWNEEVWDALAAYRHECVLTALERRLLRNADELAGRSLKLTALAKGGIASVADFMRAEDEGRFNKDSCRPVVGVGPGTSDTVSDYCIHVYNEVFGMPQPCPFDAPRCPESDRVFSVLHRAALATASNGDQLVDEVGRLRVRLDLLNKQARTWPWTRGDDRKKAARSKRQLDLALTSAESEHVVKRCRELLEELAAAAPEHARTHYASSRALWHTVLQKSGPELAWKCDS